MKPDAVLAAFLRDPVLELRKQHRIVIERAASGRARCRRRRWSPTGTCASARASAAWSTLRVTLDEAHHRGKRPRLLANQVLIGDGKRVQARLRHPFSVEVDEVHRLALGEAGEGLLALPDRPARESEIVV